MGTTSGNDAASSSESRICLRVQWACCESDVLTPRGAPFAASGGRTGVTTPMLIPGKSSRSAVNTGYASLSLEQITIWSHRPLQASRYIAMARFTSVRFSRPGYESDGQKARLPDTPATRSLQRPRCVHPEQSRYGLGIAVRARDGIDAALQRKLVHARRTGPTQAQ